MYHFGAELATVRFGMNDCIYWMSDNGFPRVNPLSVMHNLKELLDQLRASGVRKCILSTNHLSHVHKFMLR